MEVKASVDKKAVFSPSASSDKFDREDKKLNQIKKKLQKKKNSKQFLFSGQLPKFNSSKSLMTG